MKQAFVITIESNEISTTSWGELKSRGEDYEADDFKTFISIFKNVCKEKGIDREKAGVTFFRFFDTKVDASNYKIEVDKQ